jgi:hypothetical protein
MPRPLPGQPGAQRDARVRGTGRGWALPATASVRAPQGEPASRRRAIATSRWDQLQPGPMTPSDKVTCSGPAAARSASTARIAAPRLRQSVRAGHGS